MQRSFEILSVWLTVLAIAVGGVCGSAVRLRKAPAHRPEATLQGSASVAKSPLQSDWVAGNRKPQGQEVAERGEGRMLLANSSSPRQLIDGRLKATNSPVLDEPQADRHMLLALARSAVANSAGHVPLLRSTHLRI